MAQRRHHYEHAFEAYLRGRRIPYISVDEAKKSLLPGGALTQRGHEQSLKSFDFVVYGQGGNLLVEVKGRRLPAIRLRDGRPAKPRLESWVTLDDIEALGRWRSLFGPEFEPVFVFMYWCQGVPPDGLFVETIAHRDRWYTLRVITLEAYTRAMRERSAKWGTVHLSTADFEALSTPFCVPGLERGPFVCSAALALNQVCKAFVREPALTPLGG